MNRIQQLFKNKSEKLIPYITAGYPKLNSTKRIVLEAVHSGADMIEIGIPFSDPLADGPIIQQSSQIAINNGINLNIIFKQINEIRKLTDIPIVLMGYINPIMKYGKSKFIFSCLNNGVDGLIVPDLPPEEGNPFYSECKNNNISPILLVAPNTPNNRIKYLSELYGDLLYCVSILGVTGTGINNKSLLKNYLNRVKNISKTPIIVGFGITTRNDVKFINSIADGAVVGSALIKGITTNNNFVEKYIKELKGKN